MHDSAGSIAAAFEQCTSEPSRVFETGSDAGRSGDAAAFRLSSRQQVQFRAVVDGGGSCRPSPIDSACAAEVENNDSKRDEEVSVPRQPKIAKGLLRRAVQIDVVLIDGFPTMRLRTASSESDRGCLH